VSCGSNARLSRHLRAWRATGVSAPLLGRPATFHWVGRIGCVGSPPKERTLPTWVRRNEASGARGPPSGAVRTWCVDVGAAVVPPRLRSQSAELRGEYIAAASAARAVSDSGWPHTRGLVGFEAAASRGSRCRRARPARTWPATGVNAPSSGGQQHFSGLIALCRVGSPPKEERHPRGFEGG